jgi:predicted enzyme related to lactoylglutathione lyase
MTTRTSAPLGAPCWLDLMTSDVERARAFYPAVFGWEALPGSDEFGGYFMFTRNGIPVAGGMPADPQGEVADVWSVYLATADAAKTVEAATGAGGQVLVAPMAIADLGTMGVLVDSGGAAIGCWQPGSFHGFGLVAEHGAPGWFELLTRDYAGSLEFYKDVFGWQTEVVSDTDEFRYTALVEAGTKEQLAGLMDAAGFLPEGVPPHWGVYLTVDDTDAAVATAVGLGASIMEPAADTPYGRIAHLTDPMGASFRLVGPNDAMPATTT